MFRECALWKSGRQITKCEEGKIFLQGGYMTAAVFDLIK